jgi:outer membrane protein
MKKIHIILILASNLILIGGAVAWFYLNTPKVGYIKIQSVYAEFTLKKELEKKIISVTSARKNILDSMEIKLKAMNLAFKNIKDNKVLEQKKEEFKEESEQYFLKKKSFTEDNERTRKDYEDQILKQLNQYIYDYGKQHELDFIYGASGNGSMMYGSDKYDITEAILNYVNECYSGGRK